MFVHSNAGIVAAAVAKGVMILSKGKWEFSPARPEMGKKKSDIDHQYRSHLADELMTGNV